MTNRREFLQIGMAASAWPIAAQATTLSTGNKVVPFYKVVFDTRYQDSQKFANQMKVQGVPVHGITGDITPFWFKELDAIWKKEAVAVAGMTAHGPLFCLERLAWDQGLRVVYRAQHTPQSGNIIEHTLSAPESMVDKSRSGTLALGGLDKNWAEGVAKLMQECPLGHVALDESVLTMPVSEMSRDSADVDSFADPLISWIIAPAKKGEGKS